MGHMPFGLARQASKAHMCGALVMAYMCSVVWHQQLSMVNLCVEVVGVSQSVNVYEKCHARARVLVLYEFPSKFAAFMNIMIRSLYTYMG